MYITLKEIIDLLSRREKLNFISLVSLSISLTIIDMAGIASILPLVTTFINGVNSNVVLEEIITKIPFLNEYNISIVLAVATAILVAFGSILRIVNVYSVTTHIESCRSRISSLLLDHYLTQGYNFFLNKSPVNMAKILLAEVDQVFSGIYKPLISVVTSLIVLIGVMAVLFIIDPYGAFLTTTIILFIYLFIYKINKASLKRYGNDRASAITERFESATEALQCIKEIKIYNREYIYKKRFFNATKKLKKSLVSNNIKSELPGHILELLIFSLIMIIILSIISSSDENKQNFFPLMAVYAFSYYRLKPAINSLYANISKIYFNIPAIHALKKELANTKNNYQNLNNKNENFKNFKKISLKNIYFKYPNNKKICINIDNIELLKDQFIGVYGNSGEGKTTLVDIISGLIIPDTGFVLIDDVKLTVYNIKEWMSQVSYVNQHTFIVDGTVSENIALGSTKNDINNGLLLECINKSGLTKYVEKLEHGINTQIGSSGILLSGGERQRIGIARALYKNTNLIILDEPTSSLDSKTELEILNTINSLKSYKTIILVSHVKSHFENCNLTINVNNNEAKVCLEKFF